MDVKTGSGAFMPTLEKARALARSIVAVANGAGLKTHALITDMNEALAPAAGNAVEVRNAVDNLTGARRDARLIEVTTALGAEMLLVGALADDLDDARARIAGALDSGAAAETFGRMVAALGGPVDFVQHAERYLPRAPVMRPVPAGRSGRVMAVDTRALGLAVVMLGGGRTRAADRIDPGVGLTDLVALDPIVAADTPLAIVHARDEAAAEAAVAAVRAAYHIGQHTERPALLVERITAADGE